MNNQEILRIACRQSAIDLGCGEDDFLSRENKVVTSAADSRARKYLTLPFALQLVSYGSNVVAAAETPRLCEVAAEYLRRYPVEHCFETPHLHALDEMIAPEGMKTCFMAEYFLPDMRRLLPMGCPLPMRTLEPEKFSHLYLPQWSNALCAKRSHLDMLAVGAYDGDTLVGLAGASADCESMWQIGIDVLPDYRRRGIASALISRLACEILSRGKVPFYCAAWSNIPSVRSAIRSGFRPAWVELTARRADYVEQMNRA
ncbi:MAG: GNAT family N-acetyltransferase [Ruminococcaceae bacterium]|nr:GNAT family N-acetyltransferase [Oscillospiraceae bacterium]